VSDAVSVAAELDAEHWLGNGGLGGANPLEGLLTVRPQLDRLAATVGLGAGLSRGIGAPDFRVIAGIAWSGGSTADVATAPAATAPTDAAPGSTGATPPTDALGSAVVRVVDPGGRPIGTASVRVVGAVGDPLVTGPDGILETRLPPGSYEVTITADGYSPITRTFAVSAATAHDLSIVLYPSKVRIDPVTNQIYLVDKVFFQLGKSELVVGSFATLDGLVEALLAHPEIHQLRIEGHTDARGDDAANLTLSQARAEAVRTYLVSQGIAPERLVARGFGETRPLQPGDSEEVCATNRRVEFHLVP
ncbi:MAG: OmpA family protein, partial [Myxococcota bacterium]